MGDKEQNFIPSTSRIEAFSDGVIAIIMTLMVFDLKLPPLADTADSWDILKLLPIVFPKFVSFAMSFLVLAIFWVNHHHFFHSIKSTDRKLLWYNNHLLFWLSLVPFPTALIGNYPTDTLPVMLYGFILMMSSIAFNLMRRSAQTSCLFHQFVDKKYIKQLARKGLWGPLLYGLSVIVAPISIYCSLVIFIVVPIVYFLPNLIPFGDEISNS